MARKSTTVQAPAMGPGRDAGKLFHITEMPAAKAEKWAFRLFIALKGTGAEVPIEVARLGMVGVAIRGLNAFFNADVKWADLEPLLDEMFECVQIVRDPNRPEVVTPLTASDIEDVQTRGWLRSEVLSLHVGFSFTEALLQLWEMISVPPPPDSSTTKTSPPSSGQ